MIISLENRYIYLAVPKTGTVSVQNFLLEHDPTARKFSIEIDGKQYKLKGHGTALHAKKVLGEHYSKFRVFGFIRNPYSRIVSSYFFYKQGGKRFNEKKKKNLSREVKFQTANLLPFKLWSLIYPYKSNVEHFVDENGKVIVDYIGTFENMNEDLSKICTRIGLDVPTDELKHTNKSNHSPYMEYFSNKMFAGVVNKMIQSDLNFYNKYKFNLRSALPVNIDIEEKNG